MGDQQKDILKNRIVKRTILQQLKGIDKYGTEIKPNLYSLAGWYEHLQQELADAQVYNESMMELVETIIDVLQAARVHNTQQHTEDVDRLIKRAIYMLGDEE